MVETTHEFTMHPKMLIDIIERQAGTLPKAILEAGMNAIEAGATRFEITASNGDDKRVVMVDDGCGIKTRQELEDHFRQFGTPHDKSEQKMWAQFRMGRGQCFAQGQNVWQTCGWQMTTDIRADKAASRHPQFKLVRLDPPFAGCKIEINLYNDKWYGTIEALKDEVREQLRFVKPAIIFNGQKVNDDPDELEWTFQDDDAYYLFGVGQDLTIYNLGAKCQKIPASRAGVVGVVVSKKQLKVNFARNEVMSDCPIMARINEVVKANRVKKTRNHKPRLTAFERAAALADLRDEIQDYESLKAIALFTTTSGRSLTFTDIRNNRIPWCFGRSGDLIADKLMQAGQALIIDRKAMDELGYTDDEQGFFDWIASRGGFLRLRGWQQVRGLYRPLSELKRGFSETCTFIPPAKWRKVEKRLVKVLEGLGGGRLWGDRAIVIGLSDGANAWTDGRSYICLDREFIRRSVFSNVWGAAEFMATMVHETAHDARTDHTHCHSNEFYETFHNLVRYGSLDGTRGHGGHAFRLIDTFVNRMRTAIRQERADEAKKREEKATTKVEQALRGKPIRVAADKPRGRSTVARKKRRRPLARRMPGGAE